MAKKYQYKEKISGDDRDININVYVKPTPFYKRWWFIVLMIFLSPFILLQANQEFMNEKAKNEPRYDHADLKINSEELIKAYEENKEEADKKYKDKIVDLTGEIKDIQNTTIILKGSEDKKVEISAYILKFDETSKLENIVPGQKVTIRGLINTKTRSSSNVIDIELKNPSILGAQYEKVDLKISAEEFAKAYDQNKEEAEKKYIGKIAEVTGKIRGISIFSDEYYILLKGYYLSGVTCRFIDKSDNEKLSKLKEGDTITVLGMLDKTTVLVVKNPKLIDKK